MQRLFGIVVVVGLIWLGVTIFTQGTDAVFGGWFGTKQPQAAPQTSSTLERFRASGEAARNAQQKRIDKQLQEADDAPDKQSIDDGTLRDGAADAREFGDGPGQD